MATGKSYVNFTPAKLGAGMPEVYEGPEGSSCSGNLRGEQYIISGGYLVEGSVGGSVFGFLERAGQDGTADGQYKTRVYRARPGTVFRGTLKATFTQTMVGSQVAISRGSSTAYLDTATATTTHNAIVLGLAGPFVVSDVNPEVYFMVAQDHIQFDAIA